MNRRQLVMSLAAGPISASLGGCARWGSRQTRAKIVVVGGGCAGATVAKYLRLWSAHSLDVTLIEPSSHYISSPLSNRVIDGELSLGYLTRSYDTLRVSHGVRLIADRAISLDPIKKLIRLGGGASLRYDKIVLAPGIDPQFDSIEGLAKTHVSGRILAAWSAGAESVALRMQLDAMPDGGVFAITVPEAPYRCPPAPYERASLIAAYFQRHKPRSKVLVLDANHDVVAMPALFKAAWRERYGSLLEYRNEHQPVAVEGSSLTVHFDVQESVRADVLNVLPPLRAGAIAVRAGLANINDRWCEVDFRSFESTLAQDVYILGDAIQAAPKMPKTGQLANGHAKVAAAAIIAAVQGRPLAASPMLTNTCYSLVGPGAGVHSTANYRYVDSHRSFEPIPGSGSVSSEPASSDAKESLTWAASLWADMLA